MMFRDRQHAAALLARKLEPFRESQPVVLGLARGGLPVALEVARALGAPLDVMVVRKLGAPGCPEYALGAIAEGGAMYVSQEALLEVGLGESDLATLAEGEAVEVARRVRAYRGDRPGADLVGRTVILVDDGVATGATARAAARAARGRGAARVVLAAPVIAAGAPQELRSDVEEVVAVEFPEPFIAVGCWYERFGQVSDEEVVACLERARARRTGDGARARESREPEDPVPPDPPQDRVEKTLAIPLDDGRSPRRVLDADLVVPSGASGLVMFVHGSGSNRYSPRDRFVAEAMRRAGFATLLLDLLMPEEAFEDEVTPRLRFDVEMLTRRVLAVTRHVATLPDTRELPLGYLGASTGTAAALGAAAELPEWVAAVVSRGGRPDLVPGPIIEKVQAPVLLVVGGRDETDLRLNRSVLPHLAGAELAIVPGATHLFEEHGALQAVNRLATSWFARQFQGPRAAAPQATAGA